jgi:3-hydroxyisobutyrate dehydrogenase-like beta-hydroxyacid dehydrogenase
VSAGFPVAAFDPRADRLAAAVQAGVVAAADEADLAGRADILVTVLPGAAEVRGALLGARGALAGLDAGSCWLDLTSNDPRIATEIAVVARARGVTSVGAPMGGSPEDAVAGTLRFYVGGADEPVARVTPVFAALGDRDAVTRAGLDVGSGFTTKLLANTLWFGQAIAATEVLLLGRALGLGVTDLRDALAASPGGSAFITHHLDALLAGDYLTSFGLDRVVEELETVVSLADAAETPSTLTDVVVRLHREALDRFGPVDGELLGARLLEEKAGTTLSTAAAASATPRRAASPADPSRGTTERPRVTPEQ